MRFGNGEGVKTNSVSRQACGFTRQLATLLGAGIPLDSALGSIIDQAQNASFKKVIAQLKQSVSEGETLSLIPYSPPDESPLRVRHDARLLEDGTLAMVVAAPAAFLASMPFGVAPAARFSFTATASGR